MRPMLAGFLVALGCSIFALKAEAQSVYVYSSGGRYVAGSVVTGQVLAQPQVVGTVVGQPVVTGGIVGEQIVAGGIVGEPIATGGFVGQPVGSGVVVGEPIVAGGIVGQPVITGEVVNVAPTTYIGTSAALPAQGQILPYSYWVSAPAPARVYVEYGAGDQFPFHGRAYGSPSDRWSWYNMGGGASRYLAKYYYPILQ
jgi:hypothetical protein